MQASGRVRKVFLGGWWLAHLAYVAHRMAIPWERIPQGALTAGIVVRLALLAAALMTGWALLRWPLPHWWPAWTRWRRRLGWARGVFAGLSLGAFVYLVLWAPVERWFVGPLWLRDPFLLATFFYPLLALWLGLWAWPDTPPTWGHGLAAYLTVVFTVAWLDPYTEVSAYPFSQTWSEGNRLWDYSILFGRARYNYPPDRPIPVLGDLGRMALWGLPYLWPRADIVTLRLWNAILFTVPYLVLAVTALRRAGMAWRRWVWVPMWGFVFLAQGPIYTPLVLSAWLVALAWRTRRLPWAALLVALAGLYAEETRYTWMFAPALWAGMLALGDWPAQGRPRPTWWRRPLVLFAAGIVGGVALPLALHRPQALHLLPSQAESALSHHPLMWERLWPNPTFPPGLLPGILLATLPVVMLLTWSARRGWWQIHLLARIALAATLTAFFAVGTIVSVKIGGGNNLHNYDMYLIGLLLALALAWKRGLRTLLAQWDGRGPRSLLLAAMLLGPAYFTASYLSPRPLHSPRAQAVLEEIRAAVREASTRGEVLFMDQRQLLTFGLVDPIPLVPEYEKKWMMNEAMAENGEYFARYYRDLAAHRFSLIVTEPLKTFKHAGRLHNFALEHNSWQLWVAKPTLCFYEPLATYRDVGVQLLVPRDDVDDCAQHLPTAPSEPLPQEKTLP